jgi:DNA-binding response OmpR family regulator
MKKKILIADDDEGIVDLLQCAFEGAGFTVLSCLTGSKMIDMVHKQRPDLIILDLMMPGIDGYSLQIKLDADESTRTTPVIIITALPAARSLFAAFPQVKLFVHKPFDTTEFVNNAIELCGGI